MISGQGQGLLAVAVTGLAIGAVRWAIRRFGKAGVRQQKMKDECVVVVALSQELQERAVGQLHGTTPVRSVQAWDAPAYRKARAMLLGMTLPRPIESALTDLDEARAELLTASAISAAISAADRDNLTTDRGNLATAVRTHAAAIDHFATAASILVRVSWPATLAGSAGTS